MNPPSSAVPELSLGPQGIALVIVSAARPWLWSLRRELWEHSSIYLAPLGAAAVFLFGFLISLVNLGRRIHGASALDPARLHEVLAEPYELAATLIMGIAFKIGRTSCRERVSIDV